MAPGEVLAQDRDGEHHGDHGVERRQHDRHGEVAHLRGEDERRVAGHVQQPDHEQLAQDVRGKPPRLAPQHDQHGHHHRLQQPDDDQQPERAVAAELPDADVEPGDGEPRGDRPRQTRGAIRPRGRGARDEHDRRQRTDDPDHRGRHRDSLHDEPEHDRHRGREDARGGRDDAHAPHREAPVEAGDADDAADPGGDRPRDVRERRHGLAEGRRDRQRREHPGELGEADHAEQRRPAAEQPAAEVPGPPGHRRRQAQDDDDDPRPELRQGRLNLLLANLKLY